MLSPQEAATIEAVESLLQYKFTDSALLWEALNIKPVITPGLPVPPEGNKRLAIIGDSVLQLSLAEEWYRGGTSRGHWSERIISKVGANANLDLQARALGLERFISGPLGGKAVADTVEAILGVIYLDSSMAKAKTVVEALDLLTPVQRVERELDMEGFVELSQEDLLETLPNRRRNSRAPKPELSSNIGPASKRRRRKNPLRLGHGRVKARLGAAYSLSPESYTTGQVADASFTTQVDFIEISD